jgi:hypothetical protein
MKLHTPTKIIFLILAAMLILAVVLIIAEYPKSKSHAAALSQPAGTCAPNLSDCANNPKLCMDENKTPVCN